MSYKWKVENVATNSMFFDDNKDVAGKGKYFKSRFLQPGLVKYSFGVCVLEKETIDKFVQSFVGVPVIIGHQDLTQDTAEKERVGSISNVWYNNADGWYWCDGIIFNDNAIDLIKNKNFNVSCQYIITEYSNNKDGKLYNANPYDKIILNGIGEHLAIVENARYQGALISVNALEKENEQQEEEKEQENDLDTNVIIQAINEIKENSMFKNLFKKEEKMDREEIKSIFMECLTELTASNEAEKKEEVKEEVKEEKEEVAENKCKNEEPDYKKMYEELKAEKEAKNEAEKEENEKAKNAILEGEVKVKSTYITERRAIELGKELF